MTIHQISVFLENRAGQLAEITGTLAAAGVDLRAIHIAETADYGVLRMIADQPRRAAALLSERDYVVSVTPVVAVAVPDRPGGLHEVVTVLAAAGIDVQYMYSAFGREEGQACMVFRVDEPETLCETLLAHGISPVGADRLGICD